MTADQADEQFGTIVFATERYVVRAKEEKGEVHIVVHKRTENDIEALPRGYMLGHTALITNALK